MVQFMNIEINRWELVLDERFSKHQILQLAETLHHDEAGISDVCRTMLYATRVRSSYNAAWILHHLATRRQKDLSQGLVSCDRKFCYFSQSVHPSGFGAFHFG